MTKANKIYNTLDYLRRKGKWRLRKSAIAAVNTKISLLELRSRPKNPSS